MQRVKALPLHSSPGCRTLFREGRSTKYWLNEVSQRHISKSEIKPSTPTESQVSLGKPHSRDKARQTGNLPVQYVNPKNKSEQSLRSARFANLVFIKRVLES